MKTDASDRKQAKHLKTELVFDTNELTASQNLESSDMSMTSGFLMGTDLKSPSGREVEGSDNEMQDILNQPLSFEKKHALQKYWMKRSCL